MLFRSRKAGGPAGLWRAAKGKKNGPKVTGTALTELEEGG